MKLIFINGTSVPVPRQYLLKLGRFLKNQLPAKHKKTIHLELTLVFLNEKKAKKMNHDYRGKNYATDVLSFDGDGVESLGELVLCPSVLKKQAKDHGLTYREELAYMVIHGMLHLLGYDHENNPREAKKMFQLQDQLFQDYL